MILSVNPGSSSLKYKLFKTDLVLQKSGSFVVDKKSAIKNHRIAAGKMQKEIGLEKSSIKKICVRVVHGGGIFDKPTIISNQNLKELEKYQDLAPLHNPVAIEMIKILKKNFKNADIYAVFDTAFFADLPVSASRYAIPMEISEKFGIKRFGFHGISHQYVLSKIDCLPADGNGKKFSKIISVHLGAGCSVAAIKNGKPLDTSMGFTPAEGLVMQTRSGDIDPGIIFYLIKKIGYNLTKEMILNKSGLKGLTATSGEMLDVLALNDKKTNLALDIYISKIKKYIGGYAALMAGVDIIAFTGKIGAGSEVIRNKILDGLEFLNFKKILIVEPDEELAMANEIANL